MDMVGRQYYTVSNELSMDMKLNQVFNTRYHIVSLQLCKGSYLCTFSKLYHGRRRVGHLSFINKNCQI